MAPSPHTFAWPTAMTTPSLSQHPCPSGISARPPAEVVTTIDELLARNSSGEIASILNQRGMISGTNEPFYRLIVDHIIRAYLSPYVRSPGTGLALSNTVYAADNKCSAAGSLSRITIDLFAAISYRRFPIGAVGRRR